MKITLKSGLTKKEIKENFRDDDVYDGITEGLEEALAYEKGNARTGTSARKRSLPDINVADLRNKTGMTQREFAEVLGVSTRTVESWEAGSSTPSPTAAKLMYLISRDPALVNVLETC